MPQVSKRYIPEEKLRRIFDLFFSLIVSLKDKNEAENVLAEFLTPTEKVMIAKRITCFYLIYKKVSASQIANSIKLSTSTVTHLTYVFENSKWIKKFLTKRLTQEKIKNFLEDVLVELFYGMPRKGSDWRYNKKIYFRHKLRRQHPI